MNRQLVEIASWRLVSELHRRYPHRFRIIETHPGGGQYDCLALYDGKLRHIADFNRNGRFHVFQRFGRDQELPEPFDVWPAFMDAYYPGAEVLDRVCAMLGLSIPKPLPPSTLTTLVYRFIATFLCHATFRIPCWECRNGCFDTSADGGGLRDHFKVFPGATERLRVRLPEDIQGQPGYRFWFLCKDAQPLLCLETVGNVWREGETEPHSLQCEYQETHRIWPVVYALAGSFLP